MGTIQQEENVVFAALATSLIAEDFHQLGPEFRPKLIEILRSIDGATETASEYKQIRMLERQLHRTVATHRETGYRASMAVADGAILLVDFIDQILGDVVLKLVAGNGRRVCIPGVVRVRHDDQEMQISRVIFELGSRAPIQVITIKSVQQINDGKSSALRITQGKEHAIAHVALERAAVKNRILDPWIVIGCSA